MMKRLFLALALLFPALAYGQGSNYSAVILGSTGRPVGGAQITVCAAGSPGVPCSPSVNIYQNQALTIAQSNPIITDAFGNFNFWAAPSTYEYTVTGLNVVAHGPFTVVLPCIVGASCASAGGLPNTAVAFSSTPSFDASVSASYSMMLIGNTAPTIIGTPVNGNTLRLSLPENSTGGWAVTFPGNFVIPPACTFNTLPNAPNIYTMLYDGANWNFFSGSCNGSSSTYLTVPSSATPVFSSPIQTGFSFTMTGNVTASVFSTTAPPGTLFAYDINAGAGGFTFAFPVNVTLPNNFSFVTTAGYHNHLSLQWNGTAFVPPYDAGAASTGATPAGNDGDYQKKNASALAASGINEPPTGTTVDINKNPTIKGPNPYFDILNPAYGGYFEPVTVPVTSVCSITASSTTLSCVSNTSFLNGHGVVIPKAGLLPLTRNALFPTVPTVGTVTPIGVSNGSTTYSYCFVLEDYFGGLTACGTNGSTTSGAATLGVNTVPLTNITRVSGLDTFACSTNCNLTTNAQVQIAGATGGVNSTVNGTVVVNSIVDPTHFTVLANGMPDYSESFSGTLSAKACNELFPSGLLTQESVIMRTWIYRGGTLVGVSPGQDPFYIDCGQGVSGQPAYVPISAPGAAQAGYLATTISSGGGTTTMTLAASAGTTATSQTVQHDNSSALLAAYTAALASHGGVVRIPVIPAGGTNTFPFNASTNLSTVSNPTNATVRLELASVTVNQPWILPNFFEMNGIPQVSTSFQYGPLASISGNSHPLILGSGAAIASNGVRLSNVKFVTNNATGQSSIVLDQVVGGGGKVGWVFNDVALAGNSAPAIVIKGGFDFWFTRGVCGLSDVAAWAGHPCIYLTNASTYLNAAGTQAPGRVYINQYNLNNGTGIQVDNAPLSNLAGTQTSGGGDIFLNQILHESNAGPTLRVALGLSTTSALGREYVLDGVHLSDNANGAHQPMLELTGNADVHNITVSNGQGAAFEPTILGGGTGAAPLCVNNLFTQGCGATPNQNINGVNSVNDGGVIGSVNGGSIGYLMSTPAAPASCVVSAGGSVPISAVVTYGIIAVDRNNISFNPFQGLTLLGPTCSVTTSSGQQTVTVTHPTLPSGAIGWLPFRGFGSSLALANIVGCGTTPLPVSTTTFVDTFATACGQSAPQANTAYLAGINSGGMNASHFFGGAYSGSQVPKTGNFTFAATDFDILGDPTGGAFTGTLPHAIAGQVWKITNVTAGANLITIQPDSGTILTPSGAASSVTLASGVSDEFNCSGTTCFLKSSNSGGSTNVVNCNQFGIAFYSGVGVANTINCFGPPVVAGTFIPVWSNPTAGATTPQVGQLGTPVNTQSGNYTVTNLDRAASIRFSGGTTATLTLPAIAFPFGSNFSFQAPNYNSGNLTITPTTQTINGGANLTVLPGWRPDVKSDLSPAWFADLIPTFNAFTGSCQAITFNSSTGFPCATLFYQLVGNNGTSQTARNRLNFIPGTGVTLGVTDNAGTGSTDVTINSSGGGLPDPGGNGFVVRTALNTDINRTFTFTAPLSITNPDGVAGNPAFSATINICTNYPITTLTGTANTVDCPAVGTLVLPTSVTTFSNNNYKVVCSNTGVVIQRGSGASGLKFTGDKSGTDGCVYDDGAFTSTARFIEVTGNDDIVKNNFFQNHGATSSAFPTIDITGSATRTVVTNNVSTGTQVDPFIMINSASTASGTVDGPTIEGNRIVAFAPTASATGIGGNQVSGSSVLNVSVQRNFVKSSTANAHNYEFDGQVVVQNTANMNFRFNNNESTAVTAAPAVHMRLFGQYLVSGQGNLVNTAGLASVQADCNFGDLYNATIGCIIHGGANEVGMNCVDCENSDFDVNVDNVGGGFAAFSGSSSSNPFKNNIIRVHAKLGANAIGFQIKGNGSGKPADYNRVINSEIVCNGNANTTGGQFDIGNSSTGKNNAVDTTTFQGCSGSGSVDLNIANSAMSFTTIGSGVQFDSGDTKTISDSGTSTQFTAPLMGGGVAGKGQVVKKAQTAALTTTTILTTDADAEWRVYLVVDCTTTSAAATATPSVTYTDTSNTAQTITGSAAACTALGASSFSSQDLVFSAKAATAIQYAVAIANTPTYDFRLVIERLTTQ